jgi:hypothetical protein
MNTDIDNATLSLADHFLSGVDSPDFGQVYRDLADLLSAAADVEDVGVEDVAYMGDEAADYAAFRNAEIAKLRHFAANVAVAREFAAAATAANSRRRQGDFRQGRSGLRDGHRLQRRFKSGLAQGARRQVRRRLRLNREGGFHFGGPHRIPAHQAGRLDVQPRALRTTRGRQSP